MKRALKRIVKLEILGGHNGCNHGAWTAQLTLECGHTESRKGSKMPADRAVCRACTRDLNQLLPRT